VFDCSASGGRGAPSQRTSRIATQLKNLVKSMSQAKRDNLKKHTMEEKSKIAAKVQAFSEKKVSLALVIVAFDVASDILARCICTLRLNLSGVRWTKFWRRGQKSIENRCTGHAAF